MGEGQKAGEEEREHYSESNHHHHVENISIQTKYFKVSLTAEPLALYCQAANTTGNTTRTVISSTDCFSLSHTFQDIKIFHLFNEYTYISSYIYNIQYTLILFLRITWNYKM